MSVSLSVPVPVPVPVSVSVSCLCIGISELEFVHDEGLPVLAQGTLRPNTLVA